MPAVSESHAPVSERERHFDWPLCYEAEELILRHINTFSVRNTFAATLARRMRDETGTLLLDWTDHLVVSAEHEAALRAAGYTEDPLVEEEQGRVSLWHPQAMLPAVRVDLRAKSHPAPLHLAVRADFIADFIAVHQLRAEPDGAVLSRFRRVLVSEENDCRLEAVERRGYRGYTPGKLRPVEAETILKSRELFHTRPRQWDDDAEGFRFTLALVERVVAMVGRDLAAHFFWEAERVFWQRRNRAAQVQKRRQDALGLGWANHDHHTPRCSRRHFLMVAHILETLGFERRERYHAGHDEGWGAQIWQHPVEPVVVFADVDLLPEERDLDFSRIPLPETKALGTVGLWTGLHGDSFLEAGMHHLEARFDHALLREQLVKEGVQTMKPFSDFEFLRQAFTEGERWPVCQARAQRLLDAGSITKEQFDEFVTNGAIGSHLENLQRRGGFKGFNQQSVSVIIAAVDPRKHFSA
ncbi:MAG: hypothetical protein HY300_07620 [Verrucomicrobia bacterium]|nr:hypothetical protein [Verrucomicrobiota bacterium]